MNWVEADSLRDRAIEAEAEIIWDNVCAAVRDAVESFNREYRRSKSQLKYQAGPRWVALSIQLPSRGVEPARRRYAMARISFERKHQIISCKFTKSSAPEVTIGFEAGDDSGDAALEVFLRNHPDGPRIKDEEAASRLMLREFLKGVENA